MTFRIHSESVKNKIYDNIINTHDAPKRRKLTKRIQEKLDKNVKLKNQIIKDINKSNNILKNRYRLTQNEINRLKEFYGEKTIDLKSTQHLSKHIYYNRRGVWLFDIFMNRDYKNNPEEHLTTEWGIFLHGNSGFVKAYEMNSKKSDAIRGIFHMFLNKGPSYTDYDGSIQHINYPVLKIISDDEKGVPNENFRGTQIIKVKQTDTDHRALAKINAFANHLRKWHKREHEEEGGYITSNELNEFIDIWNKTTLPNVGCTRIEMLQNEDYETAYIAGCMYHNAEVGRMSEEAFKENDYVKIKQQSKGLYGKPGRSEELPGSYKIVSNENGKLTLVNVDNPRDTKVVSSTDVTARTYRVVEQEEIAANTPEYHIENNIHRVKVDKQNRRKAQLYKISKSNAAARETFRLEEIKKEEDKELYDGRVKRRVLRELKEGEEQTWRDLPQQQRTEAAKVATDQIRYDDFSNGFLTGWTEEEKYMMMKKFSESGLTNKVLDTLFPDSKEYFTPKKKVLTTTQKNTLMKRLNFLMEDDERFADDFHNFAMNYKNELAEKLRGGYFLPNKPGPEPDAVTQVLKTRSGRTVKLNPKYHS